MISNLKPNALKAFTIVESIVAMVIILISFGTGMMIYLNVMTSEKLVSKTQAYLKLEQELKKVKTQKIFIDETKELNELFIVKKIKDSPLSESVIEIHLTAFNYKKEKLAEISAIINIP